MYSLNIFTLMLPPPVLMDGVKLIVTNASASWKINQSIDEENGVQYERLGWSWLTIST